MTLSKDSQQILCGLIGRSRTESGSENQAEFRHQVVALSAAALHTPNTTEAHIYTPHTFTYTCTHTCVYTLHSLTLAQPL